MALHPDSSACRLARLFPPALFSSLTDLVESSLRREDGDVAVETGTGSARHDDDDDGREGREQKGEWEKQQSDLFGASEKEPGDE